MCARLTLALQEDAEIDEDEPLADFPGTLQVAGARKVAGLMSSSELTREVIRFSYTWP